MELVPDCWLMDTILELDLRDIQALRVVYPYLELYQNSALLEKLAIKFYVPIPSKLEDLYFTVYVQIEELQLGACIHFNNQFLYRTKLINLDSLYELCFHHPSEVMPYLKHILDEEHYAIVENCSEGEDTTYADIPTEYFNIYSAIVAWKGHHEIFEFNDDYVSTIGKFACINDNDKILETCMDNTQYSYAYTIAETKAEKCMFKYLDCIGDIQEMSEAIATHGTIKMMQSMIKHVLGINTDRMGDGSVKSYLEMIFS